MQFWQAYSFEPGVVRHWRLGLLDLWVERAFDEWRVASRTARETHDVPVDRDEKHAPTPVIASEKTAKPAELPWRRVMSSGDSSELTFVPVMPDRPLVVRPESPLVMPPKAHASLFVSIPVWVRLVARASTTVAEVPTVVLSNTWFGDPASGELCYSLSTRARRSVAEGLAQPHRAVCPVRVANLSAKDLQFQRMCLHVGALSVFGGADQLYTSGVEVSFQAEEQVAKVQFGQGPPKIDGLGAALSAPRAPRQESVLRRGFMTIRSLTGL